MDHTWRNNFFQGLSVKIIQKNGKITEGKVKEVLTLVEFDPSGIFVKLETGESGNVIEIIQTESEITYNQLKSELLRNLQMGEMERVEFKETFSFPTNPEKKISEISKNEKKEIQSHIAKTIAAFANAYGGTLYVGIQDRTKEIKGLERDYQLLSEGKRDADGLEIDMMNNLPNFFERGNRIFEYIKIRSVKIDGKDVCVIKVTRSEIAFILNKDSRDFFYVRSGGSSENYSGTKFVDYWVKHLKEISQL